jgi:molybdenum cofactor cytidylyltransferase
MKNSIAAVVLAAGQSTRMGSAKMLLPWGRTTVIGQVVRTIYLAGIKEIVVVTGGAHKRVENSLKESPARMVFNPNFKQDHMAGSLSIGLAVLPPKIQSAMVALGDQPQIETHVIQRMTEVLQECTAPLVIPSFQMRRGHPWIINRTLWDEIMTLEYPDTLRDFLRKNRQLIHYVDIDNNSILRDLDTLSDYHQERPPTS